jgi:hypothetical protein
MCVPSVSRADDPIHSSLRDLAVFDANAKRIGKVISVNGSDSVYVAFKIVGHPRFIVLPVYADRFGGDEMFFESEDCTGAAFFLLSSAPELARIMPRSGVSAPGSTLYLEDQAGVVTNVVPRSRAKRFGGSACEFSSTFGGPYQAIAAVPVSPSIDLDTLFVPPFRVKKDPVTP